MLHSTNLDKFLHYTEKHEFGKKSVTDLTDFVFLQKIGLWRLLKPRQRIQYENRAMTFWFLSTGWLNLKNIGHKATLIG